MAACRVLLTEREHERYTQCLGNVDMSECRRIADDGVHGKRLSSDWIRSKSRFPETFEHRSRHLSLRADITVRQGLPGGKQTRI